MEGLNKGGKSETILTRLSPLCDSLFLRSLVFVLAGEGDVDLSDFLAGSGELLSSSDDDLYLTNDKVLIEIMEKKVLER